jgi:hypothetical protein
MFTKLTDTSKAAIFTVLVLLLAALAAFTLTSNPVVVNEYLAGDNGILIFVGAVIGAIWIGHMLRSGMDRAQEAGAVGPGAVVPEAPPTPAAVAVPR